MQILSILFIYSNPFINNIYICAKVIASTRLFVPVFIVYPDAEYKTLFLARPVARSWLLHHGSSSAPIRREQGGGEGDSGGTMGQGEVQEGGGRAQSCCRIPVLSPCCRAAIQSHCNARGPGLQQGHSAACVLPPSHLPKPDITMKKDQEH